MALGRDPTGPLLNRSLVNDHSRDVSATKSWCHSPLEQKLLHHALVRSMATVVLASLIMVQRFRHQAMGV